MVYLVHHTLNRNGTYTGGKRNALPFDENIITDKSQHKKDSETSKSTMFPFKTNGRKFEIERPIHGIINSCEIEGAYLDRVLSIFLTKKKKKYIMTFSEKKQQKNIFVNLKDE